MVWIKNGGQLLRDLVSCQLAWMLAREGPGGRGGEVEDEG